MDNNEADGTPLPALPWPPPDYNEKLAKESQLEIADRLQAKWLHRMEYLLDSGLMSATDMATLSRVLMQNGWVLDARKLPKGLKDKLTSQIDPLSDDEEWPGLRLHGT